MFKANAHITDLFHISSDVCLSFKNNFFPLRPSYLNDILKSLINFNYIQVMFLSRLDVLQR